MFPRATLAAMVPFWKMAVGYLMLLGVAAMAAVTVFQRQPSGRSALLQLPGRNLARKQALLYDSVTLGPYGSYDPATWYFHDDASSSPEFIYQVPTSNYVPKEQQTGGLMDYDAGDVIYQNEDLSPSEEEPEELEEAPWGTMDGVTFQVPITGE